MSIHFDIITIFPNLFTSFLSESLIKRAQKNNIISITTHDLRAYTHDAHKTVDDTPYGGGVGMVMKPEPLFAAVRDILARAIATTGTPRDKIRVLLMTPQGETFTQARATHFATAYTHYIILCGRYEGFDERVREFLADEQISIGDFVLQGGEIPAMAFIEAVSRLLPGVLGKDESSHDETFSKNPDYIEYPQYTKPADFEGHKVPQTLISGDHKKIAQWRDDHARPRNFKK